MNNELERMREDNNHYHEQAQVAGAKINDYEKRIAELHLPWRILEYGDGATINNGYRDNIGRIWNTDNAIAIVEAVNAAPELRQRIAELEDENKKYEQVWNDMIADPNSHASFRAEIKRLREENERLLAAINGCDAGYRLKDTKIDELVKENDIMGALLERYQAGIQMSGDSTYWRKHLCDVSRKPLDEVARLREVLETALPALEDAAMYMGRTDGDDSLQDRAITEIIEALKGVEDGQVSKAGHNLSDSCADSVDIDNSGSVITDATHSPATLKLEKLEKEYDAMLSGLQQTAEADHKRINALTEAVLAIPPYVTHVRVPQTAHYRDNMDAAMDKLSEMKGGE